jgi:ssDNA-binding replication factor A large subunit
MTITCRKKSDGNAVFMITVDEKIVAQLKLRDKTLDNMRDVSQLDLSGLDEMKIRVPRKQKGAEMKIKDLTAGMKNFKLRAKVIEKSAPKIVYSKWGSPVNFSSVMISDEAGTINMTLWGNQADMVSVGDAISVEGASTKKFAGKLQVRIGRGKLIILK